MSSYLMSQRTGDSWPLALQRWSNSLITRQPRVDVLPAARVFSRALREPTSIYSTFPFPPTHRTLYAQYCVIYGIACTALEAPTGQTAGGAVALSNIMPLLLHFSLIGLQSFEVVQTAPCSVLHFSSFKSNASSLVTVRLEALTIHGVDPSHLAGFQTLDLDASSCQCMLHQTCMATLTKATLFPGRPTMKRLYHLSIRPIILHFHFSFYSSSIVSIKLGEMHGSLPASIPDLITLFSELSSLNVEELKLNGVVSFANWKHSFCH
ncbi:hypothetical protein H2248_000029 [Termitomyces sp. 'cryptogamus']|nr:hypothetical protein H2248_000029 [Termitomyces sp. 'cryptogamus']